MGLATSAAKTVKATTETTKAGVPPEPTESTAEAGVPPKTTEATAEAGMPPQIARTTSTERTGATPKCAWSTVGGIEGRALRRAGGNRQARDSESWQPRYQRHLRNWRAARFRQRKLHRRLRRPDRNRVLWFRQVHGRRG